MNNFKLQLLLFFSPRFFALVLTAAISVGLLYCVAAHQFVRFEFQGPFEPLSDFYTEILIKRYRGAAFSLASAIILLGWKFAGAEVRKINRMMSV